MRGAIRLALAMLAIASPAAAAEMSPASDEAIAWDPAIRHGVLPNGLRYAVMRNATPAGGVSLRLGVAVGSLDETDAERGAAHFVEHLAFGDGGPGTEPEASFAAAGAAVGRDRNAETGYYSTTYRIDLPRAGGKALPLAFAWLRAAADGGDFGEAAVSRERGVILAERESELTDETAAQEARLAFVLPGQRVNDRDPIGTLPSLAAMTPERLKAFRQRWYRPANAVVVVVGDAPPEALAAQVAAAFGDWSPGPIPERAASPPVHRRPLRHHEPAGLPRPPRPGPRRRRRGAAARGDPDRSVAARAGPAPRRGPAGSGGVDDRGLGDHRMGGPRRGRGLRGRDAERRRLRPGPGATAGRDRPHGRRPTFGTRAGRRAEGGAVLSARASRPGGHAPLAGIGDPRGRADAEG
jgi:hypothetical protein